MALPTEKSLPPSYQREHEKSVVLEVKEDVEIFFRHLTSEFTNNLDVAEDIAQYRCKTFSCAAVLLFYVDVLFDILFSLVADKLEDMVHIFIFCVTVPVRYCFRKLSGCSSADFSVFRSQELCENVNEVNRNLSGYRRMANFGIMLRKLTDEELNQEDRKPDFSELDHYYQRVLEEESKNCYNEYQSKSSTNNLPRSSTYIIQEKKPKSKYEFDMTRLFCFDFKLQSYDSVNNWTNFVTIVLCAYFYVSSVNALYFSFSEEHMVHTFIEWIDRTFNYEIDIPDITLISLWIIISLTLRMIERNWLLLRVIEKHGKKYGIEPVSLYLGHGLRMPQSRLLKWKEKDSRSYYFHDFVTEFQLLFVKFFCDQETFLMMRRRYRDTNQFMSNQLSFHKDVFGFVVALLVSLIVKYFTHGRYSLEYVEMSECKALRGRCIDAELDPQDACWCGINLLDDFVSALLVAFLGSLGSVATVRVAMGSIFKLWRQRKIQLIYKYAGRNKADYFFIPCDADIISATYGCLKDEYYDEFEKIKDASNAIAITGDVGVEKYFSDFKDVTEAVKDYLYHRRGNAILNVVAHEKRCLIIKGRFRNVENKRDIKQVLMIEEKGGKATWIDQQFIGMNDMITSENEENKKPCEIVY